MNRPRRALLVDDDIGFLDLLRELLEAEGFEVDSTVDPETGIELYAKHKYDLITLDFHMPGADGSELNERICNVDEFNVRSPYARKAQRAQVVVISGQVDHPDVKNLEENRRISAVFSKPLDVNNWIAWIRKSFPPGTP